MKNLPTIIFFIVMGLYLWFPYSMIADQQRILKKGEVFRFITKPVDPYDAFRGRVIYLNLAGDNQFPDPENQYHGGETVYVKVEKDATGYAFFSSPSKEKPESGHFIKTYVSSTSNYKDEYKMWIGIPENLDRFYLNEKLAPQAEKKFNELSRRNRDSVQVYLDARVYNGEVLIEELYFEGQPVGEYLKN